MLTFSNQLLHLGTHGVQHTAARGQAQAARGQAALGAHPTRPAVGVTLTPAIRAKRKQGARRAHGGRSWAGPGGPGPAGELWPPPRPRVWPSFPVLRAKTADGNPEVLKTSLQKRARPGRSGRPRLESFSNCDLRQSLKRWASSSSPVKWVWASFTA